ncbi:MAG TPA: hypothetical protein P5572_16690 [Phycisphaerae bacterium]|nr:hypothetical protein [Phycisphaerae bacterium]
MISRLRTIVATALLGALLLGAGGCIVAQPPGNGKVMQFREPTTGGTYFVYLPEDYVKGNHPLTGKRWPLVVTFHGMRPFDDAGSQIREWQQEADRYGYVVLAPKTATSDVLRQLPSIRLRTVHAGVRRDEKLTLAAMDDLCRRVDIDPTKVLSTSWSSGGYLAHYMLNRHPDRFTCIAPRQSNFSSDVLDDAMVPRYRDVKVGIFYTENDFAICQRESQEAARWYNHRGFDVTFAVFRDLGHERRPSVAADFFAQQIGVTAKTPPVELARMQVTRVPLNGVKDGKGQSVVGSESVAAVHVDEEGAAPANASARSDAGPAAQNGTPPRRSRNTPRRSAQRSGAQPADNARPTPATTDDRVLQVRVSSAIGIAPHHVNFSAVAPKSVSRGAYFLWTDNGEPVANGINGQKYLLDPGEHVLEVTMTTAEGRQYVARKTVTVLERSNGKARGSR